MWAIPEECSAKTKNYRTNSIKKIIKFRRLNKFASMSFSSPPMCLTQSRVDVFPPRVSFWPLPAPMFSLFLPRLPSPFINCSFSTNDVIWLAFFCGLLLLFLTGPINLTRLSSFYRIKNCFRRHHPVPSILAPHCLRCSECRQQSVNEKSHHENSTSNKLLINTQRTGVCMKVLSVFLVVVCAKRHFSKINVKEKLSFTSCCCFSNSNRI